MGQRKQQSILFLCTGNYYRSRFAEILFNSVAQKMALPWRATSRGLALELGVNNVGPMSAAAIAALKIIGVCDTAAWSRLPAPLVAEDLERADKIVALKQAEHSPLLQVRFPAWTEKVEFWHIDDAPEVLGLIEREVMSLVARILGGGERPETPPTKSRVPNRPMTNVPVKTAITVKVGRETAGRRGKGVTTVFDLPMDDCAMQELAATLKQRCGTGGTVKNGKIEIQGDQRDRLIAVLQSLGYRVKRAGG